MNPLVVSCASGLEDLLIEELAELGYAAERIKPSKVLVRRRGEDDVATLNFHLRQAVRVYLLAWVGEAQTLGEIRAQAEEVDYSGLMDSDQTFAVRGVREGEHPFTSMEIAAEVGSAVTAHFQARHGVRVRAHLDEPDVEFFAELSDAHFMIALNTTGEPLTRRHPRRFQHFAPLQPPIAAALLRVARFDGRAGLLDPLAGGGTIPMEACFIAKGIPPGAFRDAYAFERLRHVQGDTLAAMREHARRTMRPCLARIGASDRSTRSLRGMWENFAAAGVDDEIRLWHGDAETLEGVEPGEYAMLVTNPPFGMRVGNPRVVGRLYERLPEAARRKEIEQIVLLTPRRRLICDALDAAGYHLEPTRRFLYGNLETFLIHATASPAVV